MTGIIQILNIGINTDNFLLYSDVDNYLSAFEINVSRQSLLDGFPTDQIPNGTQVIRVLSTTVECPVQIDISLNATTSTSTSTSTSTTTTTTTIPAPEYRFLIGGVGASGITNVAEAAAIGSNLSISDIVSIDSLADNDNIMLTTSKSFAIQKDAFDAVDGFEPGISVTYFFDIDSGITNCNQLYHEFYNVSNGLLVFYSPSIVDLGDAMFDANFVWAPSNFIQYCFSPSVTAMGISSGDDLVFRTNSVNCNLYIDASLQGNDVDLTVRTYNSITYATPTIKIQKVGTITEGTNILGSIDLTWSAPTAPGNIDAYFVFQDFSYVGVTTSEAITINELSNKTTSIRIIAIDDKGNHSDISDGQSFTFN